MHGSWGLTVLNRKVWDRVQSYPDSRFLRVLDCVDHTKHHKNVQKLSETCVRPLQLRQSRQVALPYQVAPLCVLPKDRSECVPPSEVLLENQHLWLQCSSILKFEQQHCKNTQTVSNISRAILLSENSCWISLKMKKKVYRWRNTDTYCATILICQKMLGSETKCLIVARV